MTEELKNYIFSILNKKRKQRERPSQIPLYIEPPTVESPKDKQTEDKGVESGTNIVDFDIDTNIVEIRVRGL